MYLKGYNEELGIKLSVQGLATKVCGYVHVYIFFVRALVFTLRVCDVWQ